MTGEPQRGRARSTAHSDPKILEYVPKGELDRALEEVQRLARRTRGCNGRTSGSRRNWKRPAGPLKRQTAPFSRRKRKAHARCNGRKAGSAHGKHYARPVPASVEERYVAPLPERCPCGGRTVKEQIKPQYQKEIVRQKIVRQFDVEIGHCTCCGKRLQGRHSLQTSDALDAAQVQVGPEALTLAAHLNKQLGVSYGNVAAVLRMGLQVSRGGLCRAVVRLGRKAEPTYQSLKVAIRQKLVIWMDETGWKVEAVLRWMWVVVSDQITVYAILPGRGFAQASELIGADYAGGLHHDGWRVYYQFVKALHQS